MGFLGNVIKSTLQLKTTFSGEIGNPGEVQQAQLLHLLKRARATSFGIYYGFEKILAAEDPFVAFRESVPVHDYDRLAGRWWNQQQVHENITWPGKPHYFALSSGTTGKESKRIPVTEEMLATFRSVSLSQVESLLNYELPSDFFEKDMLLLGSSTDLQEKQGHLEGEISGINARNVPSYFEGYYKPGPGIARIDDWDERIEAIASNAKDWDVGAIAGIPSWVLMMLYKVMEKHQLNSIHDIWPSLQIYVSGGVAFEPYRESFNKISSRPMIYQDTYLASEGFFAFTNRPGTLSMKMALQHGIFYEFIPFGPEGFDESGNLLDHPKTLNISEVEEGKNYALLVSTPAGAWRYMIGDTIRFTDLKKHEILISGRTKYFLNVVGSQLSEEKMNQAILHLSQQHGMDIKEFGVAAIKDEEGRFFHQWVLGCDAPVDEAQLAEELDQFLKELNKNYKVARRKALSGVKLRTLPTERIYAWLEVRKKKGGQIKMPKVMNPEIMDDLLTFSPAKPESIP